VKALLVLVNHLGDSLTVALNNRLGQFSFSFSYIGSCNYQMKYALLKCSSVLGIVS